jgi:uncharacterized protein YkwD
MSREIINTGGSKRIVREIPKSQEQKPNSFEDLSENKQNEILDKITKEHERKYSSSKIKAHFLQIYDNTMDWLKMREHNPYHYKNRLGYILTTLFLFALSVVGIILFYTNAEKLNSISLWIFKLAGVLLLISSFFAIKYGYSLIKEIINWLKRQRNWLKYLIIILLIILLWQVYVQRETALNPLFNFYNKTNFSYFNPVILSSLSSADSAGTSPSVSKLWDDFKNVFSVPEKDYPLIESKILELVNQERARNGARALSSSASLNSYARSWSEQMISGNFFEHSKLTFSFPSTAGENIGEVPIASDVVGCGQTYSNDAIAECFVSGWIESPGHHKNMINREFSMSGIGIACDSSKCRATQVFSG